jgi:hypothetical protein
VKVDDLLIKKMGFRSYDIDGYLIWSTRR